MDNPETHVAFGTWHRTQINEAMQKHTLTEN